jgi:Phage tail sheath protein subtilisin-like domain/Phage tail sheath C-terminal domain
MAFQVSPGVNVSEIDLTTIVPAVSTTEGAFAGVFRWGPVEKRILVDSEINLVNRYGRPSNFNAETWFTAANFLAYGNRLYIARAGDTTGNTVEKEFANQVSEASNNSIALANATVGNTTSIVQGMVLSYANNPALPVGAMVMSVNATHVTLSEAATANANAVSMVFRDNVLYNAAALQSDLNYDLGDVTDWDAQVVKNDDHYAAQEANGHTYDLAALYIARYPGDMGNSLRVSVCDSYDQYKSNTSLQPNAQMNAVASVVAGAVGSNTLSVTVKPADTANTTEVATANALAAQVRAKISVGDLIEVGNTRIGYQFLKVTAYSELTGTGNTFTFTVTCDDEVKLSSNTSNPYLARYWEFHNSVEAAPDQSDYVFNYGNTSANDELHIVVVDEGGKFTTSPGTILEVYRNLSRATDAQTADGTTLYYKNAINTKSQYIWFANDRTTARSNTAAFVASSTAAVPLSMRMVGGNDGLGETAVPFGTLAFAYDLFKSGEDIDISLVLQGKARGEAVSHYTQLGNYLIDNIAESRKDCVVFISPDYADVVSNLYEEANDVIEFRNELRSSSYGVMDSGYKYQYDKYNDVYRWVPLNGDIAGLCVRTDMTNDPWWSPAGLNRGVIKNLVRLAYNPRKADRDSLYKAGCNPVVSTPGLGTYLFGDKTLLTKPSAFDRINVRRLFIVLEKSISTAAKYTLFEFNDDFTRAQFRNLINPYLRDVKGRRGIYDFLVVCDSTNNSPEVIDRNEFVGDIYIKPARSINFIQLNFVAVRTGVAFSEVVGKF